MKSPQEVAAFLDGLLGPTPGELLVDELRGRPDAVDVVQALEAGDHERGARAPAGSRCRRRRRGAGQAPAAGWSRLFGEPGPEHPLSLDFRRAAAAALRLERGRAGARPRQGQGRDVPVRLTSWSRWADSRSSSACSCAALSRPEATALSSFACKPRG